MTLIFLMVLFVTPDNLTPHQNFGYGPRMAETLEICLNRRTRLQNYLTDQTRNTGVQFEVFCAEFSATGYQEAVDRLARKSGEPG